MRKTKEPLPVVNDEKLVCWLPRDIKLGWSSNSGKGTLLCGWCSLTDTLQLWETVGTGEDAEARFLGFVCKSPV